MKTHTAKSSRRNFIKQASALARAGPFINFGRFRLFASSNYRYSSRTIDLLQESLVIEMLSLLDMTKMFTNEPAQGKDPLHFTKDELLAIKVAGIDVFHPAVGMGGATV